MSRQSLQCDAGLVGAWSRLTLDQNPLHVDKYYAAETPFGRTIVQGHLMAALAVDEAARHTPGATHVSIRFTAPVLVGSMLWVRTGDHGQVEIVTETGALPVQVELG